MKADTKLKAGDMAITLGYYEANDGGNGEYKIVNNSTLEDDGGSIHILNNGFRAELIVKNMINLEIFGGVPSDNNTEIFQNMIDFSKNNNNIPIYISKKNWKIQNTINLYGNEIFFGDSLINSEESNFNLIYTGDNSLFDTNNDINLNSIIFNGLTFSGNNKMNNFANFPVQRATLKDCSFINFNKVFILKCLGGNVVENYFNNCFFLHCNYPVEIEENTNYSYSDSIIDNCIFSDFIIAIKGLLLQWKITNNQFYSSRDEGAIYFGGYLNYIVNNNFGTLSKGIIYDINTYPQNLTNNIIDNCQFTARSENYKAIIAKGNTNYSLNLSISNCSFLPLNYKNVLFLYCDGNGYYNGITINNCQNVSKSKIGSYNNAIHQTIGYLYTFGGDYHFGFGNTAQMHIGNTTIYTTNDTNTQRNIGDLILNPSTGGIWACYGQYGNRKVLEQITNNNGNIQLTPNNYIRYVSNNPTNITTYNVGDIVIDINQGKIYISRGTYGCKELTVVS